MLAFEPHISYFKRFRMEIDLREAASPQPELPAEFFFVPWDEGIINLHAEVKFLCFQGELDSRVFASLGSRQGCASLMGEIRKKQGFLPEATWLLINREICVGTVQGVRELSGTGAIQNLGIIPSQRGQGLGKALLLQALLGFRKAGVPKVHLEVTADNEAAIRLYRRLGFRNRKTLYRAVADYPEEKPEYDWAM